MCLIIFPIFIAVLCKVTSGLYFPKPLYTFTIPTAAREGTILGRVYALSNVTSQCDVRNTTFLLYWPPEYGNDGAQLVDINHVTGDVTVIKEKQKEEEKRRELNLVVNATCTDRDGQLEVAFVQVQIHDAKSAQLTADNENNLKENWRWFDKICWRNEEKSYWIEENAGPLIFGDLRDHESIVSQVETVYTAYSDNDINVEINNLTSELKLVTPLDREKVDSVTINLTCTVFIPTRRETYTNRTVITLNVIDLNDNGPVFAGHYSPPQLMEVNVTEDGQKLSEIRKIMLYDPELGGSNQYKIATNDSLGLVKNLRITTMTNRGTYIIPEASINLAQDGMPYVADITIQDTGYLSPRGRNLSDTAVIRLRFQGKAPELKVNVSRSATSFTKVANLRKLNNCSRYRLIESPDWSPVSLTPLEGILYVASAHKLLTAPKSVLRLQVSCESTSTVGVHLKVLLEMQGDFGNTLEPCDGGCARFENNKNCSSGCGVGSATRSCTWRPGLSRMSPHYETCIPDLASCPDRVCDELEQLNPLLCPQDCTTDIIGSGLLNSKTGRGISKAQGPCWCDGEKMIQCSCLRDDSRASVKSVVSETSTLASQTVTHVAAPGMVSAEQRGDKTDSCGNTCKVTVALTVVLVSTIGIVSVIVCVVWRRRRARRSQILKHVGSTVSMNALPSDYQEEREPRPSYHTYPSPQWSPKVTIPAPHHDQHVDKWEFPRDELQLEHTLGEGEFGQVVQAQAFGIHGEDRYSTVAVKMLKPDATGTEYQDLWSELNLLKEVNHPNVIRLLGACTHNGPFYVIVEYCKYGSLKNFLRGATYRDKKSWNEKQDGEFSDGSRTPTNLALRDLLSFAWQISKGMEYLSNMKFVHRDLAARNVLVSDGRVLKISDFGLSRDIYEADAYLKMTKGRIPVKWMAPESLYAQIYTTKSDIWSYGVLLWEIVTLGASPYPGVAPERLFNLLRTGYRMDRPDDCPEEVYAVMQKCWKSEPEERPTFSRLADILDTMLQQREGYLDLTDNTAYMEERLHYLDSTDLHMEWSDNEEGYGNISVVSPKGGDHYLTAIPGGEAEDEEEDWERGKLLPPPPKVKDNVKQSDSNTGPREKCKEDVWLLKDKVQASTGTCWNDNQYEVQCV